ncbi:MAG TPA: HIT family protein [Anaerolineae bacterium]|nr:HIT family protein [Anaerolineae bacterium]
MDCIFCAIVEGRAPAHVVFEDEETLAFMDIHPANPGHTLIVPKKHVPNVYELDDGTAAAVMRTAVRVARAVREALQPDGLNLLQSNGRAGGQAIFHLHMHVIPRWYGDGLHLARPPVGREQQTIEEVAARIREQLEK